MSTRERIHHPEELLERLPIVSYMLEVDAPSALVYTSPQIEEMFGVRVDDLAADSSYWTNLIVEEDRPRFVSSLAQLRAGSGRMEIDYRIAVEGGRPVWVRDVATVDDDYVYGYLSDVTREKELEHELALERATLDAFFRESSIGLGITEENGRYIRINDALAALNGSVPSAMIGKTLREVSPEIAKYVDPLLERVRQGETVDREEVPVVVGGETTHNLVSFFPFDVGGAAYEGRVVVDITDQRRAEATAQRYRQVLEQLPLVVYVNEVDPRRRATYVSSQIEQLTGYPAEAFMADENLGDKLIHPDDFAQILERERLSTERGDVFEHEYRIVHADGTHRWVLDRMETVRDDDGRPLYEQGFLVDVTDSHETAAVLRAVWDGARDAMVLVDDERRYVDANPAACELLGRSRDELLALEDAGIVVERSDMNWERYRESVAGAGAGGEAVVIRPDGVRRDVEFSARANVMPGRHLSVLRDTTERKQLEAEIWRVQKLESVARLAGGVAHDFNNLLTAIRGYAQLLQARVAAGSVEEHHAVEIDRAADRAAALTAQLLALGRRQTLKARPLDLNRLLEEAQDDLVDLAGARTELVFDLDPALHAVRVDASLLGQAIANLVENAADATPTGGRIVVRTGNATVAGRDDLADGAYVMLSVEDDGIGLDEATLEHVFEPFFTTKDVGHGSGGLGLASAYGTVRQSGGTITVASELGRGTTFSVYLPEAAAAGDPVVARTGAGESILVVERDPAVRDVVFEVLTDASYRVLTARTTVDAVRLAERLDGPIDLLITDLDSLREQALAALLREARPGLRTLSLAKPYTPERLHAAVRGALESPERGTAPPESG